MRLPDAQEAGLSESFFGLRIEDCAVPLPALRGLCEANKRHFMG